MAEQKMVETASQGHADEAGEPNQETNISNDTGNEKQDANKEPSAPADEIKEASSGLPGGGGQGEKEISSPTDETTDADAPQEYSDFDISKGKDIGYQFSEEQLAELHDFGKSQNLNQEQLQAIVELDIKRKQESVEASEKYLQEIVESGITESKKKYGDKYLEQHSRNDKVFSKFFSEKLRATLNDFGVSSNPEFFDTLTTIDKLISEDRFLGGDSGQGKNYNTLSEAFDSGAFRKE